LPDVRSPHVRPAALSVLAALAAGTLALAGCGGGQTVAPEVPGPPATVPIPESSLAPAGAALPGSSATTTPTPTPTATTAGTGTTGTTGSTGTTATGTTGTGTSTGTGGTGGTTTTGTTGGGAAAPSGTPPPAGSDAQKFEDFCAQNPGAC
jgi:hypothetical protein